MTHTKILEEFKAIFPQLWNERVVMFLNGKNSIRLRGLTGMQGIDMIFTYHAVTNWSLETQKYFIQNTLKVDTKK